MNARVFLTPSSMLFLIHFINRQVFINSLILSPVSAQLSVVDVTETSQTCSGRVQLQPRGAPIPCELYGIVELVSGLPCPCRPFVCANVERS